MKSRMKFISFLIANLLMLVSIAFVQSINQQLAYEIGAVYAGIILGTNFAFFIQPFKDMRDKSLRKAIGESFQREYKLLHGSIEEYMATLGLGCLLAIMTITDNYTFFGNNFGSNRVFAVISMGFVGAIYGLTLLASGIWFDYFLSQSKVISYVLALLEVLFLLSLVVAVSNAFIATHFFAVGIISRSIASIISHKWGFRHGRDMHIYGYSAIVFMLMVPLIYGLNTIG